MQKNSISCLSQCETELSKKDHRHKTNLKQVFEINAEVEEFTREVAVNIIYIQI